MGFIVWVVFIVFLCVFAVVLAFVFLLVSFLLISNVDMVNRETMSPFECGFDSKQVGRSPFSIRFFIFVLLFLVFDLELVFFFHTPEVSFFALGSQIVFLVALVAVFVGFVLEEKAMRWEN